MRKIEKENIVDNTILILNKLNKFKIFTLNTELDNIQVELVKWNTLGAKEDLEYFRLKTKELETIEELKLTENQFKTIKYELLKLK